MPIHKIHQIPLHTNHMNIIPKKPCTYLFKTKLYPNADSPTCNQPWTHLDWKSPWSLLKNAVYFRNGYHDNFNMHI